MNQINQNQMSEEYILSKLADFNLDISSVDGFELSQFLDLAMDIKKEDYDKGIEYVISRRKLENVDPFVKFKYFCGYLQKIKKVYRLQDKLKNQYQNGKSYNK